MQANQVRTAGGVFAVLAITMIAALCRAQAAAAPVASLAPAKPTPACGVFQGGPAPQVPSYVDEPDSQLKKTIPGLSAIKFEADEKTNDGGDARTVQDKGAFVLGKTGAVVAGLLERMPDLIGREEVRTPVVQQGSGGWIDGNRNSARMALGGLQSGPRTTRYDAHYFTYRIVHTRNAAGADVLVESRTDRHDRQIDSSTQNEGKPSSVGFAMEWLFFLPNNLDESRFRYLGEQRIGDRKTYVLAFAQVPGVADQSALLVESNLGPCTTLLQGVAWIDQLNFEIIRLQTDLLSPLPGIGLNQIRTVLTYGAFRIRSLDLNLWLPREVESRWQMAAGSEDEDHIYSGTNSSSRRPGFCSRRKAPRNSPLLSRKISRLTSLSIKSMREFTVQENRGEWRRRASGTAGVAA